MTPQLMQAIKLLQLSNLDLSAFVEEELERNPLLERASDGTEPPVAGEPVAEQAEFSDREPVPPMARPLPPSIPI
jgi:RNA polymerase sigma-54 factor